MAANERNGPSTSRRRNNDTSKSKKKKNRKAKHVKEKSSYRRQHLHRACKLVIEDTGQCLFQIQSDINKIERPTNKIKKTIEPSLPRLPPEIWIKIFSYITSYRQYPFMCR